jgi:hypothetical protein
MKPNSLLFFLLILLPFQAGAQANYKKGLVVTEQGDTLKGFINDRDWIENPDKIYFKEALENTVDKKFDINNSSFFRIDGEDAYQRFSVSMSLDEITYSKIHTGADTSKANKTVFLKILVDGCNVNLYSYTDEIKARYYFWDKSTEIPVELSYRVFYYKPPNLGNDMQKIITLKNYIGQLNSLASKLGMNTKELLRKINAAPYQKKELSEIVVLINGNDATNFCKASALKENMKFSFFAAVSMRRSILNYMESGSPFYPEVSNDVDAKSDHKANYFPAFKCGFNLGLKGGSKFSVREELIFSKDRLSSADKYSEPYNYYYEDYKLSFTQLNLTFCSGLNYNVYHSFNLKVYLGTGINLNYSKVISSEHYSHCKDLYNEYYYSGNLLPSHEYWISFPLKAGIIFKNKFEINYILQNQRITLASYKYPKKIRTMELGVAYFLN